MSEGRAGIAGRVVSIVTLGALVALSAKLAMAPFNGTHGAEDCAKAYATARTHVDSIAVDFKSYRDGDVTQRCGYGTSASQVRAEVP